MSENTVINEILNLVKKDFFKNPDAGLCYSIVKNSDNLVTASTIKEAMQLWTKRSCSIAYPIKPKNEVNPGICYLNVGARTITDESEPPYYMEYIALRRELLEFLINYFSKGKSYQTL
jgi:hypothetical protein